MDLTADVDVACAPDVLFAWVDDLTHYPSWLEIVTRSQPAPAAGGDPGPAWIVDLRGRLGPLARTKRLRMVRTRHDEGPGTRTATFERRELDRRAHSAWILRAEVSDDGGVRSRLAMHLHYGGRLWGPVLERLLGDEIARSRDRLRSRAEAGRP